MASNKLKLIPENKTIVFCSHIEDEEEVLVRTGSTKDNSLIHSLISVYSRKYLKMTTEDKTKYIKNLLSSLASEINTKLFYETLLNVKWSDNPNSSGENLEQFESYYKIITNKIITIDIFKNIVLDLKINDSIEIYEKNILNSILKYFDNIEDIKKIEDKKRKYMRSLIENITLQLLKDTKKTIYKEQKNKLKNIDRNIDENVLEILCNKFNFNIYFLDPETRFPFKSSEIKKDRKSIVILWVETNHCEIIGKLLPKNEVQREFKSDNSIIEKIHTILHLPEKIHKLYPDLALYFPTKSLSNNSSQKSSRSLSKSSSKSSSRSLSKSSSQSSPKKLLKSKRKNPMKKSRK